MRTRTLIIAAVAIVLKACATTTYSYTTPSPIHHNFKSTAIVPFYVMLDQADFPAGTTMETVKESQKTEAFLFQEELYLAFAENSEDRAYTVEFQDVVETNRLLKEAGLQPESLNRYTKQEIGAALGVETIIYGTVRHFRNVNSSASIYGGGESDNVRAAMIIYNVESGEMVWRHDYNKQPLFFKKASGLAVSMVKDISDKFPFRAVN